MLQSTFQTVLRHQINAAIAAMLYMRYSAIMRYSTSDLSRKSGDIIARALQGPVTITQRGKPRLIMMSVEEYNRMRSKAPEEAKAGHKD